MNRWLLCRKDLRLSPCWESRMMADQGDLPQLMFWPLPGTGALHTETTALAQPRGSEHDQLLFAEVLGKHGVDK
jgi:hypothetical protein